MKQTNILAGIAKMDITPCDADITAYRELKKEQFMGVKQRLYARILALRPTDSERTIIIVGSDLINVPDYFLLRDRLVERYGLVPTDIIMGGTQNHSSIVSDAPDFQQDNRPAVLLHVRDGIHDAIFNGVGEALANLQEATLGWGTTESIVGSNKDAMIQNGKLSGANTNTLNDNEFFILRVDTLEGKPIAALLNYSTQGVFYSPMKGGYISGDLHGAVSEKLESYYGDGFIAPYLIGASGNRTVLINGEPNVLKLENGTFVQERKVLDEAAQDIVLDWLSSLQANDAIALMDQIDCSVDTLAIRSDEMYVEANTRPLPLVTGGGPENDSKIVGKQTHRLHFVALNQDLAFACGNSITQSRLGSLVKQCLPCKTVYFSVEGGIVGYVVDTSSAPETFGYRYCPFHSAEESERIYTGSIQQMYQNAQ